jgi:hypothetical protein
MHSTNKDLSRSINCSHCSFDRLIPTVCQDRICIEGGNDDSLRGNFEGAITIIDVMPELFQGLFQREYEQQYQYHQSAGDCELS